MGGDIDTAESDDDATDAKEEDNDEDGEEQSEKITTKGKVITLPVDIFRSGWMFIGNHDLFVMESGSLIGFVYAATTAVAHAGVIACVEQVVLIEVVQTVNFGLLELEVDVG